MLNQTIFNLGKTDYQGNPSLFLGQEPGLFDTVNRRFPKIWENYKTMKSLDWDELEFDFKNCNLEFKSRPESLSRRMITTLGWQWEADSVAARTVLPLMAPFISAPELQAAWGRITDNEVLHAATYSEIVRFSFDNPSEVLNEVLKIKESHYRMKVISDVMADVYKVSHEYALGLRKNDQDTYNHVYLFVVALLCLERIQFMGSFAITFAIGETGAFMPIVKAVQKIAQDEFEIHVDLSRLILANEHKTERGQLARKQTLQRVRAMVRECIDAEQAWIDYQDLDRDPLVGLNGRLLRDWNLLSGGDVYDTLELLPDSDLVIPKKNPIGFMANWLDISKTQSSPQEQQKGDYKVNVIQRNDEKVTYEIDF
jgi:ribonucleoside-diphosphate reductase beta chain